MNKVHTTLSIDAEILKRAKEAHLNISDELEERLKEKIKPGIKDLPSESLFIRCSRCRKEITEGYLCRERKLVLCHACEANMWKQPSINGTLGESEVTRICPHDSEGLHEHIYFGDRFPVKRIGIAEEAAEITKNDTA